MKYSRFIFLPIVLLIALLGCRRNYTFNPTEGYVTRPLALKIKKFDIQVFDRNNVNLDSTGRAIYEPEMDLYGLFHYKPVRKIYLEDNRGHKNYEFRKFNWNIDDYDTLSLSIDSIIKPNHYYRIYFIDMSRVSTARYSTDWLYLDVVYHENHAIERWEFVDLYWKGDRRFKYEKRVKKRGNRTTMRFKKIPGPN